MALPCSACGSPRPADDEPCSRCGASASATPDSTETAVLPTGTIWQEDPASDIAGRYRVIREIGRGAFGVVLRAFDLRLEREIAVKRLAAPAKLTADQRARFEREARILASLDHPNIVPIFDAGVDGDGPYLVMKLIDGRSLGDLLKEAPPPGGRTPADAALYILRQAAAGLAHAHQRGILHRDIKPSNILEDRDGRVFLVDFGLSTGAFLPKITQHGAMVGTLDYMAPEALDGECSESSDLYSLGAVLYHLLFGETCFAADGTPALLLKILEHPPPFLAEPPAGSDPSLVALLDRLLAKDPARRPASAGEVGQAIDLLLAGRPARDGPAGEGTAAGPGAPTSSEAPTAVRSLADAGGLAESLSQLEADVERLSRLAGPRSDDAPAVALDRILEPVARFISGAARLVEGLRAGGAARDQDRHALTLSLLYLSREVERQVLDHGARGDEDDPLRGELMQLQVRVLAPAAQLLRRLEGPDEGAPPAPDAFFAFEEAPAEETPDDVAWIADLGSKKSLRRHEAALTVAGSGREVFLRELKSRPAAEVDRLLAALWQLADVLVLEGRGRSRPIFEAALTAGDGELCRRWRTLFSLFQGVGDGYWDPLLVTGTIRELAEEDQRVFGRALLVHPWEAYRRLALELLEPPDFWGIIAHERTPLDWLLELWRHLRPRVQDDYLKVFFACVHDRLLRPGAQQAVVKVELLKELFRVDPFHETLFFRMLTQLEEAVRAEARSQGLLVDFDAEYLAQIEEFRRRPKRRDEPVKGWGKIPLPVQRLLARRGHFMLHFACHPIDPIAEECLPHLVRRGEITAFLKLPAINSRLLVEIAKEQRLFLDERPKYLLVANPKTPPYVVAKHINYLRADSLRRLIHSRECNPFAREYAARLDEKRGRFRARPGES